ncbi:hypothetical protein BD779DRAFT_1494518 [Infundibulicybe gibba]|nr:hypothetical protein BD779DRAFT_1494518 [Infundibulicybe gibba]
MSHMSLLGARSGTLSWSVSRADIWWTWQLQWFSREHLSTSNFNDDTHNHFVQMRFQSLLTTALSAAALILCVSSSPLGDSTEPEILVSASFPESNPFGHVVNGEKNSLTLSVENKSDRNVTLDSVSGSVHHPETNALVKNLTTLQYGISLINGVKIQLPYAFYSEFKPGDIRLNVWLDHSDGDAKYRVSAYDSVVTIVEPEVSILDFKMLTTYLVVSAILGGLGYFAYLSFVPQTKGRAKKPTSAPISAPVGSVTATGAGGYQEEWIPEHHLRKSAKSKGAASGTSGDELSGAETSGTDSKRRKGRK